MQKTLKTAAQASSEVTEADLAAINQYTLQPLTAENTYVFRVLACDDQVDRDSERFPLDSLQKLATLFPGKPVIMNHKWDAQNQLARIYAGEVQAQANGSMALCLRCYMPRSSRSQEYIEAIDGGILKEVSVGCRVGGLRCSICGGNAFHCKHLKRETYDGKTCVWELCDPQDALELSFVAVPAQPAAGVTKDAEDTMKNEWTPEDILRAKAALEIERERMKFNA